MFQSRPRSGESDPIVATKQNHNTGHATQTPSLTFPSAQYVAGSNEGAPATCWRTGASGSFAPWSPPSRAKSFPTIETFSDKVRDPHHRKIRPGRFCGDSVKSRRTKSRELTTRAL